MSYDLHFYKPRPGLTLQETMDVQEEEYESGNPDPSYAIDPHRIAASLLGRGLEFESSEDETGAIELNPVNHELAPIQISIDSAAVGVSIPNWDFSPNQVRALQSYWTAILPILLKEGLVGYDSQMDTEVSGDTFRQIITGAAQGAEAIRAFVGKDKPWWKFW
jgi:hypothetical protein